MEKKNLMPIFTQLSKIGFEKISEVEIDLLFDSLLKNKYFVEKSGRIIVVSLSILCCALFLLIVSRKFRIQFSIESKN